DQPERRPAAAGPLVALVVGVLHRHALALARTDALTRLAEADRALPVADRQTIPLDQCDQLRDLLVGLGLDGRCALLQCANLGLKGRQGFDTRHLNSSG